MRATHFSPVDTIVAEVAAYSHEELFEWHAALSNLNSDTATERMLEKALAVQAEYEHRLNKNPLE